MIDYPQAVTIEYTNHRGERRKRRIVPMSGSLRYGKTDFHTVEQWLFDARDLERNVIRTFALGGVPGWSISPPVVAGPDPAS